MHIVYLEELISDIEKRIDYILLKYQDEVELLITMPGIKKDTAAIILAEIGADMTQFPTSKHLASWVACLPEITKVLGNEKVLEQ